MKSDKRAKIISAVIAVVSAFLLWIYVITVVSPETTVTISDIPVVFSGEETLASRNLTIASGSNSTITLRVTGNRTVLSNLSKDNIIVTVDVSKIQAADSFTRNYQITYPSSVSQSSITVESVEPAQATFTVEELIEKELEVRVYYDECTTEEGYVVSSCRPTVETIKVTGTAEQVASLYRAVVIFDEKNLNENVTRSMSYSVVDEKNNVIDISKLKVDTDKIGISVKLLYTKNVPLTVNIVDGGGITYSNINVDINPAYVTVSGDKAQLAALNSLELDTVFLADVLEDCDRTYSIIIPDGITNESGEIQAVVHYTLQGVYTRTIETGNISVKNAPEGYHVTLLTKGVTVLLRSSSSNLETIEASDVNIYIDLSAYSNVTGTYSTNSLVVIQDTGTTYHVLSCDPVEFELMTQEDYIHAMGLDAEDAG